MTFLDGLGRAASFLLRLFTVPKCAICEEVLETESELCPDCLALWDKARKVKCPRCHETAAGCTCTPRALAETDMLGNCALLSLAFLGKPESTKLRDRAVRRLIYKMKRSEDRTAAHFCARELSLRILRLLLSAGEKPEDWILTYPPGTRARIRKYGFDQAKELTKKISRYTGIPWRICFRRIGGRMQKTLNAAERQINAEKAFRLTDTDVAGKKFLLLDDVITTGATVNACARRLQDAGAAAVFPVCVARTRRSPRKRRPSGNPWFGKYRVR